MIADNITKKIAQALKARDDVRLSTLRMLSSALNYERIAKQHDLSEDEELVVVKREAKKRKDAIDAYEKAGAKDRADKEGEELKVLQEYLPEEMDESELTDLVNRVISETGATTLADMGRVIGVVKTKAGMRADGAKIAQLVKKSLETRD